VELKLNETDGFELQTPSPIITVDQAAGVVYLPDGADLGPYTAQVRFTYTGGYAWETLEPDAAGYPTALPQGAATLPADLLAMWILQCKHIWGMMDKLGTDLLKDGTAKSLRFPEEFAPTVAKTLGQFTRYNLT
jgi:hypothetical protein